MFTTDPAIITRVEELLAKSCPAPEKDIVRLSYTMAGSDDTTPRGVILRRLALDVDDLISQTRWHLGQALLLLESNPQLLNNDPDDDPASKRIGIVAVAQLLLRSSIPGREKALHDDLTENWMGGTVAGWVYHMMIDSAIYRALSVLDRLAALVWHAAEIPKDKIYFRSKKLEYVHAKLGCAESQTLVEISKRPVYDFLLKYRDGLSHTIKAYSHVAGSPPGDSYLSNGKYVIVPSDQLDAKVLFEIGSTAFAQVLDALPPTCVICDRKWPEPKRFKKDSDKRNG